MLKAVEILEDISYFLENSSDVALHLGAEWLYQDNDAQVKALELVADILEDLEDYA